MPLLLAIILVIALLALGIGVMGAVANVLWFLLVGLVVGAIARLVVPGDQNMGWLSTALVGIAGGLIGGIAGDALEVGTAGSLALSVVAAAILVALFAGVGDRSRGRADI